MQVKKFEAPTMQEALEQVKKEMGPDAVILKTKQNRKRFGILSKNSVEITVAVSERSLSKKVKFERRLTDEGKSLLNRVSAGRQAEVLDRYGESTDRSFEQKLQDQVDQTQDRVDVTKNKRITATRYIDIEDGQSSIKRSYPSTPSVQAPRASSSPQSQSKTQAVGATSEDLSLSIEEELKSLRKIVGELQEREKEAAFQFSKAGSGAIDISRDLPIQMPILQDTFDEMVLQGVDRRFAYSLVKKVAFELSGQKGVSPRQIHDQIASELMESLEVRSLMAHLDHQVAKEGGPRLVALVGPTGVGKTTTLAKLASEALMRRKLKVGLINLDCQKVGAFEQVATFAKALNVPFRSAISQDDLKAVLTDFRNFDLVLLDTAGKSQKDGEALQEMKEIFEDCTNLTTCLVLSAVTRDAEIYEMINRYAILRPDGVIVSKLDEASFYGSIYNIYQKIKLPLFYFTTGQKVPNDIEEATRERVASLIFDL